MVFSGKIQAVLAALFRMLTLCRAVNSCIITVILQVKLQVNAAIDSTVRVHKHVILKSTIVMKKKVFIV